MLSSLPFNVDRVSLSAVGNDPRFNTYGTLHKKAKVEKSEQGKETVSNANYLRITLFTTSLKEPDENSSGGHAVLVMAIAA